MDWIQYTFELVNGKPGAVVALDFHDAWKEAYEQFGIAPAKLLDAKRIGPVGKVNYKDVVKERGIDNEVLH